MNARRIVLPLVLATAALVVPPANAVGGVSTFMTYAGGSGLSTFTCHAHGTSGPLTDRLAHRTLLYCSVNGVGATAYQHSTFHSHGVGTTSLTPGQDAEFCVSASAVYGFFPPLRATWTNCETVTIQRGGAVVQV